MNRLLNVPEAAEYIGRTEEAFRQMIHRGKIPVVRIDRRVQIDRTDLDRLIERNKVSEPPMQ
jgi:excisionase family DNA binding protein